MDTEKQKQILKNIVNSPRQNSNLNFPKQDQRKIKSKFHWWRRRRKKNPHISKTKIKEIKTHLSLNM